MYLETMLPDQIVNYAEIIEVEKDSGNVTEDENSNNCEEDECQVDFFLHIVSGS